VSDKPRRLPHHQRAQAHNSTLYRRQHSFMFWLCSKQNCLLCAYECDFDDNDIITIISTGLTTKKCVAVLSVLNLVSDFVKCNHPIKVKKWVKKIAVAQAKVLSHLEAWEYRIQRTCSLGLLMVSKDSIEGYMR
jgi:hypothetical protein